MRSIWLLVLAGLMGSASAAAGPMSSGGGHAVVCRDGAGKVQSVELFDYFEAKALYGLTLDFGDAATLQGAASQLIGRIPLADRDRRALYAQALPAFVNPKGEAPVVEYTHGADLPFTQDDNSLVLPSNCVEQQLALQQTPQFPGDPDYVINGDLFDRLDIGNRAGLILHELIYRQARSLGATDSRKARYYNSLLAANHWRYIRDELDLGDYQQLLTALALPDPYTVVVPALESGRPDSATFSLSNSSLDFMGGDFVPWDMAPYAAAATDSAVVMALATCKPIFSVNPWVIAAVPVTSSLQYSAQRGNCLQFVLFSDKLVGFPSALFYGKRAAQVKGVTMDESGTLACAQLGEDATLTDHQGSPLAVKESAYVELDLAGRVVSTWTSREADTAFPDGCELPPKP